MAYKKPEIVAKSEAKQSFVGGCPAKTVNPYSRCASGDAYNTPCLISGLK